MRGLSNPPSRRMAVARRIPATSVQPNEYLDRHEVAAMRPANRVPKSVTAALALANAINGPRCGPRGVRRQYVSVAIASPASTNRPIRM
jgi:hypothetical protein